MDPIVDVNIAVYNHARYLRKTLDSVLSQKTDFPFRLVIGDDFSTDGSRDILKEYEQRYPEQVKVIYQEKNLGFDSDERNGTIMLKHSTAKYIAFLDGDDYWIDDSKLQKQISFLEANTDYSICFHKVMVDEDGKLKEDTITNPPGITTTMTDLVRGNFIHTPSVVFRNKRKLPKWFNKAMPADYPLYLLLTANGEKIRMIDEVMAVYRVHGGGIWSTDGYNKFEQKMANTLLNCAREINLYDQELIQYNMMRLSSSIYNKGYIDVSRSHYFSHAIWAYKHTNYTFRQLLHMLFPRTRGIIKSFLRSKQLQKV
jgi:glycosyltransferase involved in cell wall biosynthesis